MYQQWHIDIIIYFNNSSARHRKTVLTHFSGTRCLDRSEYTITKFTWRRTVLPIIRLRRYTGVSKIPQESARWCSAVPLYCVFDWQFHWLLRGRTTMLPAQPVRHGRASALPSIGKFNNPTSDTENKMIDNNYKNRKYSAINNNINIINFSDGYV